MQVFSIENGSERLTVKMHESTVKINYICSFPFSPQAESQDFLPKSSSKECGSLSSLQKTVLWKD